MWMYYGELNGLPWTAIVSWRLFDREVIFGFIWPLVGWLAVLEASDKSIHHTCRSIPWFADLAP